MLHLQAETESSPNLADAQPREELQLVRRLVLL
jgi:hypothetical protein